MKRSLGITVGALALVLAVAVTGFTQQPLKKVLFALTTKDISVGHAAHSSLPVALGYWKEEGIEVEVASIEGSTAGMQQLAAGNLQFVSISPEVALIAREKGVKIKTFYVQARETIYRIVVPDDSPIKELKDLKGKTIGVPALASGTVPYSKALVASVGLDPGKDIQLLAVGLGGPAMVALQQKKVDALGVWDALQAGMETKGLKFRRLSAPIHKEMIGQSIFTSDTLLQESPQLAVAFARGIAKATVFGLANPEAAVRIHWKLYPQTKPQGVDDATALKDAIHIFNSRFELQRADNQPDKRFGAAGPQQWERLKAIYKEQGMIQGTTPTADHYTLALADQINKFDTAAIVKAAKEWKP